MDAERRHDLQENELAEGLGATGEFIKKNITTLAIALVAVILVIFLITTTKSNMTHNRQLEWANYQTYMEMMTDIDTAGNDLIELAESTSQKDLAAAALVGGGEKLMLHANIKWLELAETDRDRLLARSEAAFKEAISKYSSNSAMAAKATLGLGRLSELKGDYAAASELYKQTIAMDGSAGVIRSDAQKALELVNNPPSDVMFAIKPVVETPETETAETETADEEETATN